MTFFALHPFSDETSVQDDSFAFSKERKGYSSATPSSMFTEAPLDAFDNNLEFDASRGPRLFGSFDDDLPTEGNDLFSRLGSGEVEINGNPFFEQFGDADGASAEPSFQESDSSQAQAAEDDSMSWRETEKMIEGMLEEQVAIADAAQKESAQLKEQLAARDQEMEELRKKLAALEGLPAEVEKARQEGFTRGRAEGEASGTATAKAAADAEEKRRYDGEKADYMQTIQTSWNEVLTEIKKYDDAVKSMDEQIPEIVVGYLRELIGTERKLNDGFVVNLIKSAISKLTDKQQLVFTINPDDVDIVTEAFPQYGVSIDSSVQKGGVKIQTKTGNVDLSVEAWIDSLEKQINEQLKTA
ncbi:MAG: hypothetical protein LBV04_07615 [Deferribacteraceae bacterium]|nr:hypothetical protein [Deferribacteraceae bacterium]